jgi:mannan endo-1,4-beta-mannosidase
MPSVRVGLVALATLCAMGAASACAPADADEPSDTDEAAATSLAAASDPAATAATKTVLANLRSFDFGSADRFDRRVIIGQQEADVSNRSTNGLATIPSDMERLAGKRPALVSYELSHVYKRSMTMFDPAAFRAGASALRDRIIDQHKNGALVSLVWHMRCPKTALNAPDKFGPGDCPRDYALEELLERKSDGTRGAHFTEWRAMLDELAELLWSLKDDHGQLIPVQIRPFHEFTGAWFWWGRTNAPAVYAAVWREMVSYLRRGRGLHNALWVFCSGSDTEDRKFAAFYPGDAYVDVVAFDRYDAGDGSFARGYEADLRTIGAFARTHGKVAAVAEIGTDLARFGSADPTWFSRTMLAPLKMPGNRFAYVAIWRNAPWEKYVPEPGDGPIADDFVLMTRDEGALLNGRNNLYTPLHVPPSS